MIGDQIGETTGKRLVRRVLSTEPPRVEVSFEDTGNLLGVPTSGFGTYESSVRPDGTIFGHGQGASMTQDGDMIAWRGSAVGKFGAGGSVSYRGMLFFQTQSPKFARLNSVGGAFEFEADAAGNTHSKMWEWK